MMHISLRSTSLAATLTIALGATLGCSHTAPVTATNDTTAVTGSWVQVWSDEFDGPASTPLGATKWSFDKGDGCASGICGWGNSEKETYTDAPENIALNGLGQLAIVARTAPAGLNCYYGACRYTSAKITTRSKMNAAPGRVEARIKLSAGQGLWPAFWMLGSNFPSTPWPQCGRRGPKIRVWLHT